MHQPIGLLCDNMDWIQPLLRVMEAAINSGACDHISICRSLIREPDLVLKYERGEAETAECISCGGCFNIDDSGKMHIYCRQKKAG